MSWKLDPWSALATRRLSPCDRLETALRPMATLAMSLLTSALNNEVHDETYRHSCRVALITATLSTTLKAIIVGLLHDLGKCKIDPKVLYSPKPLTATERIIVDAHPLWTFRLLKLNEGLYPRGFHDVPTLAGDHHEYLDGSGQPRGKTARRISRITRQVQIADIADALVADRCYRRGMSASQAIATMERELLLPGKIDPIPFGILRANQQVVERIAKITDGQELQQRVADTLLTRCLDVATSVQPAPWRSLNLRYQPHLLLDNVPLLLSL
jgi:HD-GYP domain-containing protein (c-di-GMP phosphodiesterase class II)